MGLHDLIEPGAPTVPVLLHDFIDLGDDGSYPTGTHLVD